MKKRTVKKEVERKEPKFWIIWCPAYSKPPRVRFESEEKARSVADEMVRKYNDQFFVLESRSLHRLGVAERINYTGKPKKELKVDCNFAGDRVSAWSLPKCREIVYGPNHGKSWTEKEDNYLRKLVGLGESKAKIACTLGRTELAVDFRMNHLGLVLS